MFTANDIVMHAKAGRIFALASDVLRWPEILPHYRWVKLIREDGVSRIVEMAAKRNFIPVKWTSILTPVPSEHKIIFRHIAGPTRGMYVEWTMREEVTGGRAATHVRITHEFTHPLPVLGPFIGKYIVGKFFVHNIAGKTLARIKYLVEDGES